MEIFTSGPSDFYLSIYHIAQEAREKGCWIVKPSWLCGS